MDDNKPEVSVPNTPEQTTVTPKTDLEIENQALKQILAENKTMIEKLTKSLDEVKITNAKLVNTIDVSGKKETFEEIINKNYNRYAKKG